MLQITQQQERITRGAGNRKPTEKYALFQQNKQVLTVRSTKKQAKESRNSSAEKKSVCQVSQEPADEDAYILKICKEQSFKKADEQDNLFETANSTPEKGEKRNQKDEDKAGRQTLEFEDLDNILDNTKERFMKSKQLALKEQRSSSAQRPATAQIAQQASLMPKRIMSSKKIRSLSKKEQVKEEPVKKIPKDRSALIGLKRTRKSRDQIYQLQKIYEDANGKPTKASLKNLAKETGLKLQQVYKWYWDTEKKNEKLQKELTANDPDCNSPLRISRKILKTQYTDEFGGYSKTWFTDGLQEMKNTQSLEEDSEMVENCAEENIDTGLGGLALSLGLDIEAIALELAINDTSLPPIQCLPVYIDEKMEKEIEAKKIADQNALNLEKVRQVLMMAKGTQYSPVAKCKETQCSPIIIPNVIRPQVQNNNTFYSPGGVSNASVSNISSIISKQMKAQPKKTNNNPFQPTFGSKNAGDQTYTQDKIHQAFANLFGNISGGNNNGSAMPTPQFSNDNKHQIKAKPIYNVFDTPGNLINNKPQANVRSVFSPIPCIPQSECSILGVRGDRNTPYTPFSRQQLNFTPKVTPQGAGAKNFKQKGDQKEELTPGQFLMTAQPVGKLGQKSMLSRATPKNPTNVYNLYQGPNPNTLLGGIQSPFVPKQTPKQFRMPVQHSSFGGFTASPPKHQTIINLYNAPISCSNFYNSSACNQSSDHSHGSFSQNVSPTPCKKRI